jgi:hypothetical protein
MKITKKIYLVSSLALLATSLPAAILSSCKTNAQPVNNTTIDYYYLSIPSGEIPYQQSLTITAYGTNLIGDYV